MLMLYIAFSWIQFLLQAFYRHHWLCINLQCSMPMDVSISPLMAVNLVNGFVAIIISTLL
jgi:hypothetical protein